MNRILHSTIWLVIVIIFSAALLAFFDRLDEKRAVEEQEVIMGSATVYLIAYAGEEPEILDDAEELETIGCDDILVPYEIPVVSKRLKSILHGLSQFSPPLGLHNPMQEHNMHVADVQERGRTEAIISIEGDLQMGGVCDTPRLKAQMEKTIGFYREDFRIHLNGSAEKYDCIGDLQGGCQ